MKSKKILLAFSVFCLMSLSHLIAQNALHFDGTNDYVQTTFAGISGSSPRTVEAWIKPEFISSQQVILDWGAMSPNGARFTFNMINGFLRIEVGGNGYTYNSLFIADTTWHHVAVSFDASGTLDYKMFIDGVMVNEFNLTVAANTATTNSLILGRRNDGVNYFNGAIDEVRIWNYARTQTEIVNDMNAEFCSIPAGLVAYFKLDEGTAGGSNSGVNTAHNLVNTTQNGTLTGMSLSGSTSNWVEGATLTQGSSTSTLNVGTSCGPYTSPSGNYSYTQAGVYTDTIPSAFWCDSIITVDISIVSPNSFATISESACSTYITPSGNNTFNTSGTYIDTIPSASGCDSILTINLTIQQSFATLNVLGCEDYVAPSGAVYTANGSYSDTIPNSVGCDSIMTINVFLVGSSLTQTSATNCFEYVSPSGKIFTESGVYADTLSSVLGCDSILSINLTIQKFSQSVNKTSSALISSVVSATYQWYDCGKNEIIEGETMQAFLPTVNGQYAVIVTKNGCTDTSDCVSFSQPTGMDRIEISKELAIYPNPSSGILTLSLTSGSAIKTIQIMNVEGRAIAEYTELSGSRQTINTNLSEGIYFVFVKDKEDRTYLSRLIIQ